MKKILMACGTYWNSPIQIGDHHLAKKFIKADWDVAYVSDPICPLHILGPITNELKDRYNIFKHGGLQEEGGRLWSYVPGALLIPYTIFPLKSRWVHNNWQNLTIPNLLNKVRMMGFSEVEVIYFRTPRQSFWLDHIKHNFSIYRVADNDSGFSEYYHNEIKRMEYELAKKVDLVIYTGKNLKKYVENMNPKDMLYLPNGVDYDHFNNNIYIPNEYKTIKKPIVVYVGSIDYWFDFELINYATEKLPWVSFVLIGPDKYAGKQFIQRPNLFLLGRRNHSDIPSYLHNADVGIIPFNVKQYPVLVNSVNPIKLYEYFACGLPVVSVEWEELKYINSPAMLADSKENFVEQIKNVILHPIDKTIYSKYAQSHDWKQKFEVLLKNIKPNIISQ